VVACLLSMYEALDSIPSITHTHTQRKKRMRKTPMYFRIDKYGGCLMTGPVCSENNLSEEQPRGFSNSKRQSFGES
jgi:hypothetical protein